MKQLFAIICLSILVNFTIQAQYIDLSGQAPAANQNVVETECRQLKQILKLDDDQFQKIVSIKSEWQKNLEVINMLYPQGADEREDKIKELEVQYDGEFAAVLTDKQFDQYLIKMGRPQNEETANWFIEMEALAAAKKKKEEPSFNEKVQALLQEATRPKPDSAQLAMQRLHDQYNDIAIKELSALDSGLVTDQPRIALNNTPAEPAGSDNTINNDLVIPEKASDKQDQISLLNSGDLDGAIQPAAISATDNQKDEIIPGTEEPAVKPNGSLNPPKTVANEAKSGADANAPVPETPASPGPDADKLADLPPGR